jgi:hypothetical protein
VGQHDTTVGPVDLASSVQRGQLTEAVGVDDPASRRGQGEQIGHVRGRDRAHITQAGVGQVGEVGG